MSPLDRVLGRLPDARKVGSQYTARCPAHADRDASLSIKEATDCTVLLHCFAGCSIEAIVKALGLTMSDLFPDGSRERSRGPEAGKARGSTTPAAVSKLLAKTVPDTGRVAAYLRFRGLSGTVPPVLRFHPDLGYYDENRTRVGSNPAMIAPIVRDGVTIGAHRTYLAPDHDGKADVSKPKKVVGNMKGGAIHFAEPSDTLGLAEGIETALAVMQATETPTWSVISAGNMHEVEVPADVRFVEIWADRGEPGRKAAERTAQKHFEDGREVRLMTPPPRRDG